MISIGLRRLKIQRVFWCISFICFLSVILNAGAVVEKWGSGGARKHRSESSAARISRYCARTDHNVEPYPVKPPTLGRASSIVNDPTFGSRVVRVTDGAIDREFPGFSFQTPSSAEQNTFSQDSRKFYVVGQGGQLLIFNFDPDKLLARFSGINLAAPPVSMRTEAEFSFVNPELIYGWQTKSSPKFMEFDFSRKKATVLNDPADCIHLPSGWRGLDIAITGDDQRLMGVLGPGQDRDPYVYLYDKKLGCRWYNTSTGEIGGQWGQKGNSTLAKKFLIHNARISKSGDYVIIAGEGTGRVIWRVDTLEAVLCSHNKPGWCGGHFVMGYSHMINQPGFADPMNLIIRPMNDISSFSRLVSTLPKPTEWNLDAHFSWNDADLSDSAPMCFSTYRDDNPASPGVPLRADRFWDNEVLCLDVADEKHDIWRFAHTFSTGRNGFWSTPRGNVSSDGAFFMFTSDWEDTLGIEKGGRFRNDVFIVELRCPKIAPASPSATSSQNLPLLISKEEPTP